MINLGTVNFNFCAEILSFYNAYSTEASNLYAGPDDDSCVLITNYAFINGVEFFRTDINVIDVSGAVTWYRLVDADQTITSMIPFGRARILITFASGLTFWFAPQNAKLNNATPIAVFPTGNALAEVCGQNFHNLFYDPIKNVLIAGYYYPAGQYGTFINSVAFQVSPTGFLNPIASGYAGYSDPPQTPDPFDQTAVSGGAGITLNWLQSNGVTAGYGCPVQDYIALARANYSVTPGSNNGIVCPNDPGFPPTPNGAVVTSVASGYLYTLAPILPYYTVTRVYASDTSIPGLLMLSTGGASASNGPFILYGDGVFFYGLTNYAPNTNWSSFNSMALTRKYLFGQYSTGNVGGTAATIISVAANPNVGNGSVVHRRGYFAVNNTRAISPTGRFRT